MSITTAMSIQTDVMSKWSISENTPIQLMEALSMLPALTLASANDLSDSYSLKITNIIDNIDNLS